MNKSNYRRSGNYISVPFTNSIHNNTRESDPSKTQGINSVAAKSASCLDSCPPLLNRAKEKEKTKLKKTKHFKKSKFVLFVFDSNQLIL